MDKSIEVSVGSDRCYLLAGRAEKNIRSIQIDPSMGIMNRHEDSIRC